jgi:hypothetical protein
MRYSQESSSMGIRRTPKGQPSLPGIGNRTQNLFDLKRQEYAKKGVITFASFLRFETLLGTTSSINFVVTQNQQQNNAVVATASLLNPNDTFTITGLFAGIKSVVTAGAAPTDTEQYSTIIDTFPNPSIYAGVGEALRMNGFYNGIMSMSLDSSVLIQGLPVMSFYRVGTSQQQAPGTNIPQVHRNEFPIEMFGRIPITPSLEISGQTQVRLSIGFNAGLNLAAATGRTNYAVIFATGFLHTGAASFYGKQGQLARR